MIRKNEGNYPVSSMCRLMSVSVSGYYDWRNRPQSERERKNSVLLEKIRDLFQKEKSRAGAVRIAKRMKEEGINASRHRVARLMRIDGLRAKAAKKFKATTNSHHKLPVAENLLQQDFSASHPDEKYVSDITYIWTDEGWLYLAVVMDLFSRMVVGWALSERMTSDLVINAMKMTLGRRKAGNKTVAHSDRGSQYCSDAYQKLLKSHGLTCSMSKKGDCYDNAAMESWNHSFKVEAIHGERFATRTEAKNHVFDYIEVYYNRNRLHSRLGYMSPVSYEAQMAS